MAKKKDLIAIFSDKPTNKDLLNFRDYSKLLADVIVNSETPSTIGIFGEWGSGKTSLMLMVEEQLKKKSIKTIWFNAWKYDKEEVLWRALILSILRGLSTEQKTIDDTTLKLYEAVSVEKLGQMQIDWLEIGKSLLKGAAFLVAPLFLIPGIANAFANASFLDQVSNAFTRRKIQQSRERISSIEQFEDLYKKLISRHVEDGNRVAILIDDLDRCMPVRSLEVLEALKSFLDADGCVYVVACDTRLINQGLLEKYDKKSGIHIDEYLAKIVQFSFAIPPIRVEDAEKFIQNFGLGIGSVEVNRLISTTIERNPRRLKRFLSDLKIKAQLVKTRGLLLKPDALAKMSCIANTWRDFWVATLNSSSVFERAQKIALYPDGVEKTADDSEFSKIFHIDERLYSFLGVAPVISDADLQEYIFLSTATSTDIKDQILNKEGKATVRRVGDQQSISDELAQLGYKNRRNEITHVISAVNSGTKLIIVSGRAGTGKTVLLKLLDQIEIKDFITVYVDLQSYFGYRMSITAWYYELARLITQSMTDKGFSIRFKPNKDRLTLQEFQLFLNNVINESKGSRLVIMLDEYQSLVTRKSKDNLDREILDGVKHLLSAIDKLTIILSSQNKIDKLKSTGLNSIYMIAGLTIDLDAVSIDNLERVNYKRLMELPDEGYRFTDAYNMLYLFENGMRRLIAYQFNDSDWWQKGIPSDLYDRVTLESSERINGVDLLNRITLGDLFRIVLEDINWDQIFSKIFLSRNLVESRRSIILSVRNSIAHTNSNLSLDSIQEFVAASKAMIKQMEPFLPEA